MSDEEVRSLLAKVNLLHLENIVGTFDSQFGADWDKMLSPGEQQRLAFARLFYWKPVFAAIDEATSSLDSNTERHFFDVCKELGITTITVSHNKNLLHYHLMNQFIVLKLLSLYLKDTRFSLMHIIHQQIMNLKI